MTTPSPAKLAGFNILNKEQTMLGTNGLIPRAYLDSGALTTDQKAVIGEAVADYGKHAAVLRKQGTTLAQYCETVCRDAGFELPDDTRASLDRQQDRHGGVLVNGGC